MFLALAFSVLSFGFAGDALVTTSDGVVIIERCGVTGNGVLDSCLTSAGVNRMNTVIAGLSLLMIVAYALKIGRYRK